MPILVLKILFKFFYSLCAVSLTVETATTLINYTVQYTSTTVSSSACYKNSRSTVARFTLVVLSVVVVYWTQHTKNMPGVGRKACHWWRYRCRLVLVLGWTRIIFCPVNLRNSARRKRYLALFVGPGFSYCWCSRGRCRDGCHCCCCEGWIRGCISIDTAATGFSGVSWVGAAAGVIAAPCRLGAPATISCLGGLLLLLGLASCSSCCCCSCECCCCFECCFCCECCCCCSCECWRICCCCICGCCCICCCCCCCSLSEVLLLLLGFIMFLFLFYILFSFA